MEKAKKAAAARLADIAKRFDVIGKEHYYDIASLKGDA